MSLCVRHSLHKLEISELLVSNNRTSFLNSAAIRRQSEGGEGEGWAIEIESQTDSESD